MEKIITLKQASKIVEKLANKGKTKVLVGGCFDILHLGHLRFLKKAKNQGDVLFVALESDQNVQKLKGKDRPINSQKERAKVLAELCPVDYVILLSPLQDDQDYFSLVEKIQPQIIAVTAKDLQIKNKKKQAQKVGAKVKVVTPLLTTNSTTRLAKILEKEGI